MRLMFSSARLDFGLSVPLIPIYSAAEVVLAFLASALIQLIYFDSPRVPVAELLPEQLQMWISFPQTVDRKDLAFAIPLLIIAVGLVKLLASFLSTYFMERAGYRVSAELRERFLARKLDGQSEKLLAENSVEAANRLMQDTTLMQGAVSKGALSGLRDAVVLLFCFLAMLAVAGDLLFWILLFLVPFAFLIRYLSRVLQDYLSENLRRQVELSTQVVESRLGALTLFAQRLRHKRLSELSALVQSLLRHARSTMLQRTLFGPFIEYLAVLGIAALLFFKHSKPDVDVAAYSSLLILGAMTYRPLKNIASVLSQMSEIHVTYKRLLKTWSESAAQDDLAVQHTTPSGFQPAGVAGGRLPEGILLHARGLEYRTAEGVCLLKELSIDVRAGELIAFVGESGSGKTTALRVLAGVLQPLSGKLIVDVPVRLATQVPYVFGGSVRENLVYHRDERWARETATDPEGALDDLVLGLGLSESRVGARIFVDRIVGSGGEGLSGGEKARVAIGRMLVERDSLLLFDEPGASLDPENTRRFWQALRQRLDEAMNLGHHQAVIVVTHGLEDVSYCDRVFEFSYGSGRERSLADA